LTAAITSSTRANARSPRFAGRVAIVTGAGQGIGRCISLSFADEGADVVVVDMNLPAAEKVADAIRTRGRRALAVKADVTKSVEVTAAMAKALEQMGKIDILVNNAGGSARSKMSDFAESEESTWESVIGRNLIGTMNCTRAVINHMIGRSGSGSKIVNIGSGTGVSGSPRQVDYSAAKAGVIGFTKALAKEVGIHGINVNTVSPGVVNTEGLADVPKATVEANLARQAIKRLGEPQDIANAVLFLASDEASFITGQNLVVCGGARIS
jgi:NAD(P)-dependent dehydrogenase (short-subunit alcohol dehydrogenase family)